MTDSKCHIVIIDETRAAHCGFQNRNEAILLDLSPAQILYFWIRDAILNVLFPNEARIDFELDPAHSRRH